MARIEFEDERVWDKIRAAEAAHEREALEEDSWVEGEDGEAYFDKTVLKAAEGKDVLDIGCGRGEFALAVAAVAKKVVGVDFSNRAVAKALDNVSRRGMANVEFRLADARNLPYPRESFDLAFSRRGPAVDSVETIKEARRVLRKGGRLIQQEIGERDKLNWKQIFGRGQNYPYKETIRSEKKRLLTTGGFAKLRFREFEAVEYFKTINDALMRLETTPIIPNFNRTRHRRYLQRIDESCASPKGIRTNMHRVIITATK